jgi:hypothetical protein
MYIGFLWIFRATELGGEMPGYLVGPCFVELVSSQDGVHWTRQEGDRPPILPLGPSGSWDDGMVFTARAPIVEGDTIKLWYGGFDQVQQPLKNTMARSAWRALGKRLLDAGSTPEPSVKPRPDRRALRVNYRAVGGSLKVEVLDANNNVFRAARPMLALTGNNVAQTVVWAAHAELPVGRPPCACGSFSSAHRSTRSPRAIRRSRGCADHHAAALEPDRHSGWVSQLRGRGFRHQSARLPVAEKPGQLV